MPLARGLYLLPLALACGVLAAQEPAPTAEEKAPVKVTEAKKEKEATCFHSYHRHSDFGVSVQGDFPLRDLGDSLDRRSGLGLGLQWTHDHGDWNASRTRMEWNTFPEGGAVGPLGTKTYAKNYILSFDHLFKLNRGDHQAYVVAGLGGARWNVEQTTGTTHTMDWTTKLAVTGGLGVQLAHRVNLEARYVVSSVGKTFDANVMQISLGWHF
jgi:opacity protein-like surface antigen